jgi:hypothetical protein
VLGNLFGRTATERPRLYCLYHAVMRVGKGSRDRVTVFCLKFTRFCGAMRRIIERIRDEPRADARRVMLAAGREIKKSLKWIARRLEYEVHEIPRLPLRRVPAAAARASSTLTPAPGRRQKSRSAGPAIALWTRPQFPGGNRRCFRRPRRLGQTSRALSRHRRWGGIYRRPQRRVISQS